MKDAGSLNQRREVRTARRMLIGNRWALIGAIVFLLEWVAILGFGGGTFPANQGANVREIVDEYTRNASAISLSAGWFSLVLLGRVLFVAGVNDALARSGFRTALSQFALGSMVISVGLEIAAFASTAGAAHAATAGAGQGVIVGLDAIANWLDLAIFAPIGASVLALSAAMLMSRAFPAWLWALGFVAGAAGCVSGVILAVAFQNGGTVYQVVDAISAVAALAFWIWMLITGGLLFRAAGRPPAGA